MSKKKQHHEEHVDETWLIPYADMLTLLLALFIVMFAMSQTDKAKLQKMSEQFNIIFSGGTAVLNESGQSSETSNTAMTITPSNSELEEGKMNEVKQLLDKEIAKSGYSDKVKTSLNTEGLEIYIQDAVLFNSGDDKVLTNISPLLLDVSKMLKSLDNNIKVVGHTDTVPISTGRFRSNWDLSAMRAINVMSFLVDTGGLSASRFSIQGYGEQMPKFSNSTEDGRTKNRRVEIVVVRKYPSAAGKTTKTN